MLALDPTQATAYAFLAWDYLYLGQFEKSVESSDKAIRRSPYDVDLGFWYHARAAANFGLKQYDQTIEDASRAVTINPNNSWAHLNLITALALAGHKAAAREDLQRYLASVPGGPKTIAAWKAAVDQCCKAYRAPRFVETWDRYFEGLREAGMPEE